jgi:hypothetical protein
MAKNAKKTGKWVRNGTIIGFSGTVIELSRGNPPLDWITVRAGGTADEYQDDRAEKLAAEILGLLNR